MTRFTGHLLAVHLLALSSGAAAQQNPLEPTVFGGKHESQFGNFSHWSAVFQKDPSRAEIEYAVCNFDKVTPLIYEWTGPNIGVGDGGALPVGKCHILRRDVAAIEHDRSAFIAFTQAGRKHSAPAHLSKLLPPALASILPRVLTHTLRTFYGPESVATQPSLATLMITQIRSEGDLQHTISWHPPTVTVAIGNDAFGGAKSNDVLEQANRAGYDAKESNLKDMIAESSLKFIPVERLSQGVILLTKMEKSPFSLQLKLPVKTQSVSRSHITFIDTESKRIVTDFEISTFSP